MDPSTGGQSGGSTSSHPSLRDRFTNVAQIEMPPWFDAIIVVVLALAGIVAFGITGFYGYSYQGGWMSSGPFHKPAALFIFGCILFVILQRVILLHPAGTRESQTDPNRLIVRRSQRLKALAVTLVSIAIVVFVDLDPTGAHAIAQWAGTILHYNNVVQLLVIVVNMLLLGYLLVEYVVRWIEGGFHIVRSWRDKAARDRLLAALLTTIVNDAFAAAILALLLAAFFQTQVFGALARVVWALASSGFSGLGSFPTINDCTVSLYQDCQSLARPVDPTWTITFFDMRFAAIIAAFALIVFTTYLFALLLALRIDRAPGETIFDAIRELQISKALALAIEAIVTPLRRVLWPVLIFVGVLAIAVAAKAAQLYIQLLSCEHQQWANVLPTGYQSQPACVSGWFDAGEQTYIYLVGSVVLTAIAAIAVILATVLQLYVRGRAASTGRKVAGYWIPTFGLLAATVVIPFGFDSLALLIINAVVYFNVSSG